MAGEQAADFFSLAKQINRHGKKKNWRRWSQHHTAGQEQRRHQPVDGKGVVYDSSVDGAEGKHLIDASSARTPRQDHGRAPAVTPRA
jgi:hypothetical protein